MLHTDCGESANCRITQIRVPELQAKAAWAISSCFRTRNKKDRKLSVAPQNSQGARDQHVEGEDRSGAQAVSPGPICSTRTLAWRPRA
eukprot:3936162-Rhodomonas_salina.3